MKGKENMEFSYNGYLNLIKDVREAGYEIAGYHDWKKKEKPCILRHDIDFSLEKALEFAEVEQEQRIISTYFVLLTTDMYNAMSKEAGRKIRAIMKMGHEIGLHFDETGLFRENRDYMGGLLEKIKFEREILEQIIGENVNVISMHEPSKQFLESNLEIPGMVNSYSNEFFNQFKYCSDSMRIWHENIQKDLKDGKYTKLHILTHPIWWADEEVCKEDALRKLLKNKNDCHMDYIHQYYPYV
jgi:hypothetical protein